MSDPKKILPYAWTVVALLFPVALLNYLDRQMIAAMKSSVMLDIPDIGKEANWGYMLGQFKIVYAVLSPIGGFLADRFGRRFTICGSLFAWSAITYATGKVTSYEGLLWTRTLMGISEAFYIPAALALIADYHTGQTRSRATSFHQIGIYCGIVLGGFGGYVADAPNWGWRSAFNVTGLAGILYAPLLLMLLRDKVRTVDDTNVATKPSVFSAMGDLFTNYSFYLLVAYFTLPAMAGWVIRDWGPAILQKAFNISQGEAGVKATIYLQVAAVFAVFGGGWLADRWMRRSERGRIYVSAIGMTLMIPAALGLGMAMSQNTLGLAVASLILFGCGWGFFDVNNMPILSQIAQPESRATGYGIMNMVSISCGAIADWGFGAMRDHHVPMGIVFSTFAGICLVSIGLVLLIKPRKIAG